MDSSPLKKDFVINLWYCIWDYEKPFRKFYRGIYVVVLNGFVEVIFVPEVDRESVSWPPIADPKLVDGADSVLDARLQTLATATYSVTPNQTLAGQEEKISPPSFAPDSDGCVIFYVTPEEFETYMQEITMLNLEIDGADGGRYASELQDYKFVQFLLFRVITSKYFVPYK